MCNEPMNNHTKNELQRELAKAAEIFNWLGDRFKIEILELIRELVPEGHVLELADGLMWANEKGDGGNDTRRILCKIWRDGDELIGSYDFAKYNGTVWDEMGKAHDFWDEQNEFFDLNINTEGIGNLVCLAAVLGDEKQRFAIHTAKKEVA